MTTKELIEILKKHSPDNRVIVYEGMFIMDNIPIKVFEVEHCGEKLSIIRGNNDKEKLQT